MLYINISKYNFINSQELNKIEKGLVRLSTVG